MFDDFTYKDYHVRAGVRQSRTDRQGRWYGIVWLVNDSRRDTYALEDRLFDWPAGARRYAVYQAKVLIDSRRDAEVPPRFLNEVGANPGVSSV
jgi:hypothetical protein